MQNKTVMVLIATLALLTLIWLVGCQATVAPPTPTETPSPTPAQTQTPSSTPTERPTPTTTPTNTPEPCTPSSFGPLARVDPREQTVTLWYVYSRDREAALLDIVEEFNNTNPCAITVNAINRGSYNEIRAGMALIAKRKELELSSMLVGPSLLVDDQSDQATYARDGLLIDLNQFTEDPIWGLSTRQTEDFVPAFLAQSVHAAFSEQRLGFSMNRSLDFLYYNQSWLEELGYDNPPSTLEAFKDMACTAAEFKGDGTGGFIIRLDASTLAAWTLAFGGNILAKDGSGYVFNGDATIQALSFLKELHDTGCAHVTPSGDPLSMMFATRQAIFVQDSSDALPFYKQEIQAAAQAQERSADTWSVTALPHTTAAPVTLAYGNDFLIPKTTQETELAAWIFIKWFTEPEQLAQWTKINYNYPSRLSTVDELRSYARQNPQWANGLPLLDTVAYEPPLISYSYQNVRGAAAEALKEIFQGADIVTTLNFLNEEANLIQAELMDNATTQ